MSATMATTKTDGTVSEIATFEQRAKFNNVYRYIALSGAEITDELMSELDREARMEWIQTAHIYARLYRGTNDFMRKMRDIAERGSVLSVRQCRAVLNQIHRDGAAAMAKRGTTLVQPATAPAVSDAPKAAPVAQQTRKNGYYTVGLEDGTTVTIRLEDDFRDAAPEGGQMAAYLYGPENMHDYKGFAFVNSEIGVRVWRSAGEVNRERRALTFLLMADEAAAKAMGMTYCSESGRCCVCGRTLTVKGSIEAGIGPVCAKKWGL